MSAALISVGALVINWAYLELTHSQLRAATDAAAKAAVVTLSESQDVEEARRAARDLAALYRVGGQSLLLADDDIVFGNGKGDQANGFTFFPGVEPMNFVRVNARVGGAGPTGAVSVKFANLLPTEEFSVEKEAVAGRYDHDICVVVDRSASMAWDLTGVDFSYPSTFNDDSTLQNYFRAPYVGYDASEADPLKRQSRWGALVDALEVFRSVVDQRDLNPQIALVSYASDYVFGEFSSWSVTLDQALDPDTEQFLLAAYVIGGEPIIGDTNIHAGITVGTATLTSSAQRRATANRTLILLSDGRRTEGDDPVLAAEEAASQRVTIHTVSFGDGADLDVMDTIAQVGGGTHYHADTADELASAFEQIAEQLPAVLIE